MIFGPVSYVVFDGISHDKLKRILLLGQPPEDKTTEKIQKTIEGAIRKGNYEFKVLRINSEGVVVVQ